MTPGQIGLCLLVLILVCVVSALREKKQRRR